jgi:uncharacterized damage-inducible protein DinB
MNSAFKLCSLVPKEDNILNNTFMLTDALIQLFNRDLIRLKEEVIAYRNEKNIWRTEKEIANSAGNLCLHLMGNLQHFIGATLGNTGYVRNREQEFSLKDISRDILLQQIDDTAGVITAVLQTLPQAELDKEYPLVIADNKVPTLFFLLHLTTHLSYHLGQINYHRRLLDSE